MRLQFSATMTLEAGSSLSISLSTRSSARKSKISLWSARTAHSKTMWETWRIKSLNTRQCFSLVIIKRHGNQFTNTIWKNLEQWITRRVITVTISVVITFPSLTLNHPSQTHTMMTVSMICLYILGSYSLKTLMLWKRTIGRRKRQT